MKLMNEIDTLITQYRPLVESLARRYAGRGAEAEDLAQEGYVALLTLIPKCRRRDALPLFLKKSLPRAIRDAARRLRRGSHREVSIEADELEEAQALTYDDDAHLAALFLAESLVRDQKDRRLLALLTEGYSQKEAAAILGMSQQAVSARLRRMRRGAFA